MKIDARINFSDQMAKKLERSSIRVPVDMDYVSADSAEVIEWVRNELEEMFGHSFNDEDFEVANMDEILEDIKFDEFEDKTTI